MTHVSRQLTAWLAGELDEDRARTVGDHLASCAECREQADRERALWALIGAADVDGVTVGQEGGSVWPAVRARTFAAGDGRGWFFGAGPLSRAGLASVAVAAGVVLSIMVPATDGRLAEVAAAADDELAGMWLEGTGYHTGTAGYELADIWLDAALDTGDPGEADGS